MAKSQQKRQVELEQSASNPFPVLEIIKQRLGTLAPVESTEIDLAFAFSVSFVQIFLRDTPNYELSKGIYGATRSNWTYHTAMAIAQTCRMLDLTCKFEALGKRDAVIETKDEIPEIVLVAEWEWDYKDVFGKGKELDKLQRSCKEWKSAHGFLLVYCPAEDYADYLQKIAEDWIRSVKSQKHPPTLFLHTVIFEDKVGVREFIRLRTVELNPKAINVWNDRYF